MRSPLCSSARLARNLTHQRGDRRPSGIFDIIGQLFVGKIDPGFHIGHRLQEPRPPVLVALEKRSAHLTDRLSALGFGFGVDQVAKPLRRGQIEPAILERPARKLPGFRRAGARDFPNRFEHGRHYRRTAMDVKLGHVLAGKTRRRRKPENNRLVQLFTGLGIPQPQQGRPPWFRNILFNQGLNDNPRLRARDPYDRDPGPAAPAR